jgi:hypothetical protein
VNKEHDLPTAVVIHEQMELRTKLARAINFQFTMEFASARRQFFQRLLSGLQTEAAIVSSALNRVENADGLVGSVLQMEGNVLYLANRTAGNLDVCGSGLKRRGIRERLSEV